MKKLILPSLLMLISNHGLHAAEIAAQTTSQPVSNSKAVQAEPLHIPTQNLTTEEAKNSVIHPIEQQAKHTITKKNGQVYQEPFMPLSLRSR
ncbi:hypothetical protein [Acinetobacter sp. CAAS 2-6]|uniref:hypothetical protein n=1 Tax=Acinetobacter sp. CAAS 2-6 TaxID=3016358 RepID=UPI002DD6546E|nr:hypothetical protein [Acinetobacter sp. CAAS 2-6]